MNIAELNETGQPLWVFFATTISIFAFSTLTWGFSYQLHRYYSLATNEKPHLGEERPKAPATNGSESSGTSGLPVAWKIRLHQFLRLIWHGHILWTWKSGIAFSLFTGGRKAFLRSCSKHHDDDNGNTIDRSTLSTEAQSYLKRHVYFVTYDSVHAPCAYVVIHLDLKCGFDSSKLEFGK